MPFKIETLKAKLVVGFYALGPTAKIAWVDHTNADKCKQHSIPHQRTSGRTITAAPVILYGLCTGYYLTMQREDHRFPPWIYYSSFMLATTLSFISSTGSITGREITISSEVSLTMHPLVGFANRKKKEWQVERKQQYWPDHELLEKGSRGDRHCYYITASSFCWFPGNWLSCLWTIDNLEKQCL